MKQNNTVERYSDAPKSKGLEIYTIILLVYLAIICFANQDTENIMYYPVEAVAIAGAILSWFSTYTDVRKFVPVVAAIRKLSRTTHKRCHWKTLTMNSINMLSNEYFILVCLVPILRDIGEAFVLAYLFPTSLHTLEGRLAISLFGLDALLFGGEVVFLIQRWKALQIYISRI